ncbi:hypothetical protein PENSPDRAFT_601321 [Peniophora sp. CONT]|nr:hypothetical protein PENSPDRAFT_601321 [Peniophora sp. CONT]
MESSDLYNAKQQFYLGAYKSLVDSSLPSESSDDFIPILVYKARAHIALDDPSGALALIPSTYAENVALKAVSSLAKYIAGEDSDAALEELRDLCVEVEGDDTEAAPHEAGWVRVLAGTAFARAGEVEEAMETLGAGTNTKDLEAVAVLVQVYLSIHRPDLARKEFDRTKNWAEDDTLLQLIEAAIGLVTGKDGYSDCHSFFTEQLANPSLTSPHLLTSRGITRLLRGEIVDARSDLEEAVAQQNGHEDAETLAASAVAAGLAPKKADAEEIWSHLISTYSSHPLVEDVNTRATQFDEFASKFTVPTLATAA